MSMSPELHVLEQDQSAFSGAACVPHLAQRKPFPGPVTDGFDTEESLPTLILFDALDARIHEEEAKKGSALS